MKAQATGGMLLLGAAIVAMVWANSPWKEGYHHLWHHTFAIRIDDWELKRTLHHWINDGLMAMFFFVVGLELKREVVGGQLSRPSQAILPVAAGIGGMLFGVSVRYVGVSITYGIVMGLAGAAGSLI
ncbi:MAG TPA: Na+/H+ antiporter NhaA, partial [Flavobacteriales bacterium]|nr:Na+/H+ antiporter NhaA [Flavobacteriales bacterium]